MKNFRAFSAAGLAIASMTAGALLGAGSASASPVVSQSYGPCTWSADVVSIGGVPMDGYAYNWLVKTGRNDNSGAACSFEARSEFKMKGSGEVKTVAFGSSQLAQDVMFSEGGARPLNISLRVCENGVGCSDWATQHSAWGYDH